MNFSVPMTCQDKKNSLNFITSYLFISQIQHFLSAPTANCRSSDLILSNWMSSLQSHQTSVHSHTADGLLSLIHKYDVSLLKKAVNYLPSPLLPLMPTKPVSTLKYVHLGHPCFGSYTGLIATHSPTPCILECTTCHSPRSYI